MHLIYENPLSCPEDIASFTLEGQARITFDSGRMRMQNAADVSLGQKANYVLWCPEELPSDMRAEWDFRPLTGTGLCILFFSARGRNGENLFSPSLSSRTGEYPQYHHGDINAFHVSYFRRKEPEERVFHTCNLRKSYGFHLVSQGADPIPDIQDCVKDYHLCVEKRGDLISFSADGLSLFTYRDDGITFGPRLGGGWLGFRQLAPLTAEYHDLRVYAL